MSETPLIYTSRGNVPEGSLAYTHWWVREGGVLWLHQEWKFPDGEVAKHSAHGYVLRPSIWMRVKAWFSRAKNVGLTGAQSESAQGAL